MLGTPCVVPYTTVPRYGCETHHPVWDSVGTMNHLYDSIYWSNNIHDLSTTNNCKTKKHGNYSTQVEHPSNGSTTHPNLKCPARINHAPKQLLGELKPNMNSSTQQTLKSPIMHDIPMMEIEPSVRTIARTSIINCTCKITHKRDWIWSWTLNYFKLVYDSQNCNIIGWYIK